MEYVYVAEYCDYEGDQILGVYLTVKEAVERGKRCLINREQSYRSNPNPEYYEGDGGFVGTVTIRQCKIGEDIDNQIRHLDGRSIIGHVG